MEKYFGTLERGPDVPKPDVVTPSITGERRVTVTDTVELPKVYVAWLTAPIFTSDDFNADMAAAILGGGKSSRLYRALVYDQQIAQSVTVSQNSQSLSSVFEVEAVARPGRTAGELEAAIDRELEKFRTEGPEPAEVDRASNGIETRIVNRLQRLGGFGGVADRLNTYEHYLGDSGLPAEGPGGLPRGHAGDRQGLRADVPAARRESGGVRCARGEAPGAGRAEA